MRCCWPSLWPLDVFETSLPKSDEIATAEANKLSNLMMDSTGLPLADGGGAVRADLS